MIRENIKYLTNKIIEKAVSVNRNPDDIKLIAVSKNFGVNEIREAFDAGIRNFGENKALELKDKAEELSLDFNWHFIGHLQSNKVKYIVDKVKYIHSVDSLNLAQVIEKYAVKDDLTLNILLEIKTSDEATKYGLTSEDEIFKVAEFCNSSKNIKLKGLMTIAPFTDNEKDIRQSFITLRKLKERLIAAGYPLTDLSMGMTSDFEIAIEEGATFIRVGTAIFGGRYYPSKSISL